MIVDLYDANDNELDDFRGPPHLAMLFALRFLYLHGLDPDAEANGVTPTPLTGSILFMPENGDRLQIGEVEQLLRKLKEETDELHELQKGG